jgi:Ni/Co efflux regulator RcnB
MKPSAIACAIVAATLGLSSPSFAEGNKRHGGDENRQHGQQDPQRSSQYGPQQRDDLRQDWHRPDRRGYGHHDRNHDTYGYRYEQRGRQDNARHSYYNARGPQFSRGGYIPREYRSQQYVVANYRVHRLPLPPRNHQWVQVGADYVLIAIATGIIANIVLNY